jgi:hypothetical protein
VDPNEGRGLSDPFPNLKDAFALGQEALKLFFIEDSPEEKFEVSFITSPFRETTQLKCGAVHNIPTGHLQRAPAAVHHRHEELRGIS